AEVAGASAALAKRVQQLRMGGDTGAAADQFDRRAFIDVGLPPVLPQERRGKQAGHRAADDDGATLAPRGKRNRHLLDRTKQLAKMIYHLPARAEGSSQHPEFRCKQQRRRNPRPVFVERYSPPEGLLTPVFAGYGRAPLGLIRPDGYNKGGKRRAVVFTRELRRRLVRRDLGCRSFGANAGTILRRKD